MVWSILFVKSAIEYENLYMFLVKFLFSMNSRIAQA